MTTEKIPPAGLRFLEARNFLLENRLDYNYAKATFAWPALNEFNWALDYFDVISHGNSQPALWIVNENGSEQKLSFSEMSLRSSRVANFFKWLGIGRGDRILMLLGNQVELWETMLAAFKIGAVVIPSTSLLTPDDLDDRIRRGGVNCIVASGDQLSKFDSADKGLYRVSVGDTREGWVSYSHSNQFESDFLPQGITKASDPLLLYFTSGTTSKPKLVLHTHESYPVGHLSTMFWLGLKEGDVHMNISSPGWAKHAWSCFFAPWNAGACIFIHNVSRFHAKVLLNTLERHQVTTLCAPPTVWRMLIQEDLAHYAPNLVLREVIGAGEPLNTHIIEEVRRAWGLTLRDGYGQTETTAQIGNTPGQLVKPGSMGKPLPGYDIALIDADGKESDEGEICIKLDKRPTGLMLGYEDATHRGIGEHYYHTGDVAVRDNDGYITFVGRVDDVFKASDYRISPFELESAMLEHEAVTEVAVIPSPDDVRLNVPKAFLRTVAGIDVNRNLAKSLFEFSRNKLAPYKRVRRIEFVEDLPKTISGKIRRVELRAQEIARRNKGIRADLEFFEEDFYLDKKF